MMEKVGGKKTEISHAKNMEAASNGNEWEIKRDKTTRTLTRLEVHHLSDKAIICDGELGEFQFVQAVDVPLALRPVIHNVLRGVTV